MFLNTTTSHMEPADADALAQRMTADDADGWTYVAIHDPKGTGKSYVAIHDETGAKVGNL